MNVNGGSPIFGINVVQATEIVRQRRQRQYLPAALLQHRRKTGFADPGRTRNGQHAMVVHAVGSLTMVHKRRRPMRSRGCKGIIASGVLR